VLYIIQFRTLSSRVLPTRRNLQIKMYKTVIIYLGLYGCDMLSLTLTDENRLRMFGNMVLREIFGSKREKSFAC
jgi:hypothetical protein